MNTRLTRRALLGGLALGAAGCGTVIDRLTEPDIPDALQPPGGAARHPIAHLLNRATYGPRPGQIGQVQKTGRTAWLDRQLDHTRIDDDRLSWRLRRYDTLTMKPRDLLSFSGSSNRQYVRDELAVATLVRAVYSERQVFEVVVGFWTDHFSIYHYKGDASLLKTADDRDVIRKHALGTFGDLLRASAHSPAMLVYLDNVRNEKSHPNENYAREIMELHSLGVDGGYTEQDIQEVARCFTGWSVNGRGVFEFRSEWHDDGEKSVLGHTIPAGGGKSDGDRVLDILIDHPSAARFVCTKLARRFVADDPPAGIVDACVATWTASSGHIRAVLRTLFTHPDFEAAPPKLKRPFDLLVSLIRATGASFDGDTALIDLLDRLGQRPFGWPMPDGYPDTAAEWGGNMLRRWNLGLDALAGNLPGVQIDLDELAQAGDVDGSATGWLRFFGRLFLQRDLTDTDRQALQAFAFGSEAPAAYASMTRDQIAQTLGLLAASPAFQWR